MRFDDKDMKNRKIQLTGSSVIRIGERDASMQAKGQKRHSNKDSLYCYRMQSFVAGIPGIESADGLIDSPTLHHVAIN